MEKLCQEFLFWHLKGVTWWRQNSTDYPEICSHDESPVNDRTGVAAKFKLCRYLLCLLLKVNPTAVRLYGGKHVVIIL